MPIVEITTVDCQRWDGLILKPYNCHRGSEASELGGSAQDSPCLLGPHGRGLCSDTEAPG